MLAKLQMLQLFARRCFTCADSQKQAWLHEGQCGMLAVSHSLAVSHALLASFT